MEKGERISIESFELVATVGVTWKNGYTEFICTAPPMSDEEAKVNHSKWESSGEGFMSFCRNQNINSTTFWNALGKLGLHRP